jgi:restriction system protein
VFTARLCGVKRQWKLSGSYGYWLRRRGGVIRLFGPPALRVQAYREMLALTPGAFEDACAWLLRDLGYTRIERVGGSGDLAVDLFAKDTEGRRVAVQCKRYNPRNRVGSPDVQRFIGMARHHHGAERALIITTSSFTPSATTLARQHQIELLDGDALARLVEEQKRRRAHEVPALPAETSVSA